jgi:ferredoxin
MGKVKKKIKLIKIDLDKGNGCRACEMICSAFHANPKYSSNNPERSRIRMIREPLQDAYLPVYVGEYAAAECMGRDKYMIDGKEYDECDFCKMLLELMLAHAPEARALQDLAQEYGVNEAHFEKEPSFCILCYV